MIKNVISLAVLASVVFASASYAKGNEPMTRKAAEELCNKRSMDVADTTPNRINRQKEYKKCMRELGMNQ